MFSSFNITSPQLPKYIIMSAALTGFFGDAILQIVCSKRFTNTSIFSSDKGDDWGLKSYFKQHGIAESLCIATGMMTLFYIVYVYILRLPLNPIYLAVYGIILDYIFRKSEVFPSLSDYYKQLNYFESAVWGAIPLMLPLIPFIQV